MLYVGWMEWMVIIGHRSSMSTFGWIIVNGERKKTRALIATATFYWSATCLDLMMGWIRILMKKCVCLTQ